MVTPLVDVSETCHLSLRSFIPSLFYSSNERSGPARVDQIGRGKRPYGAAVALKLIYSTKVGLIASEKDFLSFVHGKKMAHFLAENLAIASPPSGQSIISAICALLRHCVVHLSNFLRKK